MKNNDKRSNERFDLLGMDLIAEYSYIPSEDHPLTGLDPAGGSEQEYRSALVHNLSQGGICLSMEDTVLAVGKEIELFLTVMDPESASENISMEFVAQVIWVSEDTAGFRTGLKFMEVPEDYEHVFQEVVQRLEKGQAVC